MKVQFCPYCGTKLDEGARFCKNCGEPMLQAQQPANGTSASEDLNIKTRPPKVDQDKEDTRTKRKTVYEGELHKCPNCGEVLKAFELNCPACGYELRGSTATNSVQQLYWELNRLTSTEQKTIAIRNYPIPNAKEDIIEFMILASSNISGEANKSIFEAWVAKFEQAYRKAQITLQNDSAFSQIEEIYEKTEKAITKEKLSHTTASAGNMLIRCFKIMPNPVFAIVAVLLVIFNVTRLINGQFSGVDIIFDVIILWVTYGITGKENRKKAQLKQTDTPNTQEVEVHTVKVPFAVVGGTTQNYAVVESMFINAGFKNVKSVPLNDLTFGLTKKVGSVDTITVNGKDLSSYFRRKFDSNVQVLITYHSLRK